VRDKLNSDPKAQAILIGVLLIAVAFFFITRMGGGEEEEESVPTAATVTVAGSGATSTATGATPGEAVEAAAEGAVEAAAAEATATPAVPSSIDVPPPPAPLRAAYKDDKTVVLLIVHDGGIDDPLVASSVQNLSGIGDIAVFVVPVSQIARYASITLGVEVSRVPALIVMRPRSLSEGTPQASVTYGFQSKQSIVQAVRDASYDGPAATYHPD
jgi:hypothetical protein